MSIYQEALGIKDTIIAHRRHLHQIPELGLELPKTAAYVEEQLQKMGYETKRIGDWGIVALAGKKLQFLLRWPSWRWWDSELGFSHPRH